MGEPLDATGVWTAALRVLWEAAGKPTGAAVKRQAAAQVPPLKVTSQSWSDWLAGKNVPVDPKIAAWLVVFLRGRAQQRTSAFVPETDAWWRQVWKRAREERQNKGGRPPGARSFGTPVVVWEQIRVGVVPRAADCFQTRAVGAGLERAAERDGTVVLAHTEVQESTRVLAGMGGVGKTQLAAAYARRAWQQGVGVLVWVNAATREGIISAYADTASRLGLPSTDRDDPEAAAREFVSWAETTTDCWWLVVLDDVHSPGDLTGLWPPAAASAAGGQVVVTTRLRHAALQGTDRHTITVGTYSPAEAHSYLHTKLGPSAAEPAQADALAAELGYLPLALSQAASYILNADITVPVYRERLAAHLLPRLLPERADLPDDHQRIVSATWELSIGQADRAEPVGLARPLLQVASVLDPGGIPQAVLTSPSALDYLTGLLPDSGHSPGAGFVRVSEEMVDGALRVLHRHSLIDHDRTSINREVRVHQLIQRATRENLATQPETGPELLAALADTAADALLAVWPQTEHDDLGQILRANTTALAQATGTALWDPDAGGRPVLFRTAESLEEIGQISAARDAYTILHTSAVRHLGADHPDTLKARYYLAAWHGTAGDAPAAIAALKELLDDQLRVLGPDHPITLTTHHDLVFYRGRMGDASVVSMTEQLLADLQRVLGPNHPNTLTLRINLASWRGHAGDATGAVSALEELLADFQRVLGPDNPHTLRTRHELAFCRGRAGDAAGAGAAFAELLVDQLRVLGPDHPNNLITRNNLALWQGVAGDAAGAAAALAELLADQLRVLGPHHPNTLSTRHNLANWRGEAGDAAGAAAALAELLADQLRVLGPHHPNTLSTRHNLALWQGKAGNAAGAAAALAELLADQLRVLGPARPETLQTFRDLGDWLQRAALESCQGPGGDVLETLENGTADAPPETPDQTVPKPVPQPGVEPRNPAAGVSE
ncbi:tetratricopeptide repeat protein [Streptomyces racemochromogenes]|uniref:Tetratricopeptide repeat protein n=1 Tax=Streptomyces racemochromogenes TaxID=67353 RepID=A0ABW7PJ60_9ACTN